MPPLSSPALVSGKFYSTRLCSFAEMLLLFNEVTEDHSLKSLLGKYHAADMPEYAVFFIFEAHVGGDSFS